MRLLMIIVLLLFSVVPVFADGPGGNSEITIYSGWSFLDAEREIPPCLFCEDPIPLRYGIPIYGGITTSVENSMLFGFKYGHYLNDHSEIEGSFGVAPSHDVRTEPFYPWPWPCRPDIGCIAEQLWDPYFSPETNLVAYHYDINFVYNFTEKDIRPYFSFGVGGVSSDFENDVRTDFAFNVGLGAKFYFDKVGMRIEVNDHVIPDHFLSGKTEQDLQVQYGFTFRW